MATDHEQHQSKGGIYYGWFVGIACMLVFSIGFIGNFVATIFFPTMSKDLGFSSADLGLVSSTYISVMTCSGLVAGFLVDRWGPRCVQLIGIVLSTASLLLLTTTTSVWQAAFYFGIMFGLGQSMACMTTTFILVRRWFMKRAAMISGMMFACAGMINAVVFPFLVSSATTAGWRGTMFWMAIITQAIVLMLVVLVIRDSPEKMGLNIDGLSDEEMQRTKTAMGARFAGMISMSLGQAVRTPQFWLLAIGTGLGAMVVTGNVQQSMAISLSVGIPPSDTGRTMTFYSLAMVVGVLLGGSAGDRFGKRPTLIVVGLFGAVVTAFGWFLVTNQLNLYAFFVMLGLIGLVPSALNIPLQGDMFGIKSLGSISGVGSLIVGIISGSGPYLAGIIATSTGDFRLFWLLGVCSMIAVVVMVLLLKKTDVERHNEEMLRVTQAGAKGV